MNSTFNSLSCNSVLRKKNKDIRNEFPNQVIKYDSIPSGLKKLKIVYPEFIDSVGTNFLLLKDGAILIYDDGVKRKDFEMLLNEPDLQDQMDMIYPRGKNYIIPKINFDPGRIRCDVFFRKMYGNSKKEVISNLVPIYWLPNTVNKKLLVTSINNVDKKLISISNELEKIPDLLKYIDHPGGTFYWRKIAGTERLSMHSFGIAIDINVKFADYWQWSLSQGVDSLHYKNRIPLEIVEIFEKHGFIWGGKWYHFDTMHFEYRPELTD